MMVQLNVSFDDLEKLYMSKIKDKKKVKSNCRRRIDCYRNGVFHPELLNRELDDDDSAMGMKFIDGGTKE